MVAFVAWELRTPDPLLRLAIFRDRGFAVETIVLGLMSVVFVPFFFFASVYAQVSLGESATEAGLYILYFFLGFVIMAQIGGRILDTRGARPAVVYGSALGAVGFYLLAGKLTDLSLGAQWPYVMLAGGGLGLMLGTASTDAVNRAPSSSYSEVTGITQTARNFGASLGLAILGAILISQEQTNVAGALTKAGVPKAAADAAAASFGSGTAGPQAGAGEPRSLVHDVELAFAQSTQTVFYIMAGVMAATFLVSLRWLPRGRPELPEAARGGTRRSGDGRRNRANRRVRAGSMVEIRAETDIGATADEIFSVIVDLRGYDRWLPASKAFSGITRAARRVSRRPERHHRGRECARARALAGVLCANCLGFSSVSDGNPLQFVTLPRQLTRFPSVMLFSPPQTRRMTSSARWLSRSPRH